MARASDVESGRRSGSGSGSSSRRPMAKYALWAVVALWALTTLWLSSAHSGNTIPLSRLLALAQEGRVVTATVGSGQVEGTYRADEGKATSTFRAVLPPDYGTNGLVDVLRAQGAEVSASQPSPWGDFLLAWIFPLVFAVVLFGMLSRRMRQAGGGALSFGRSKAKLYDRTDMKTSFADVAGLDEVETELKEIVEYLRNAEKYRRIGARIPKGVLLVGPPGTGKTLLARAVAGEADVAFFYISASEFIELFVGMGAARVRDLFEQARKRAPAIVFIDEIDAVGQARSIPGGQVGSHQEQEQTLQQLLSEMDGFEPNSGVIIMAASNRPEILDPALLRPGRFDRHIVVNLPDVRGREEILILHARGVRLAPDVDLRLLARRTPGFSGAQLSNVINEGALLAARVGKEAVRMADLEEAVNRVLAGLERRSQVLSEKERRLVAYHELGHALVARFAPHADPVHRVTIIPRGIGALGFTQQLPEEEHYLQSEPELRDRIAVLFGGRAAEEVVLGLRTTGAEDDLEKATDLARRMVMEFGMSDAVGPINVSGPPSRFLPTPVRRAIDVSAETEAVIDREVMAILEDGHRRARDIVQAHRSEMDRLVLTLLDKETLERVDLESVLGRRDDNPPVGPPSPPASDSLVPGLISPISVQR